jgi:hypothetical protein
MEEHEARGAAQSVCPHIGVEARKCGERQVIHSKMRNSEVNGRPQCAPRAIVSCAAAGRRAPGG